ncbi:MAG TPA: LemA family protein [Tepidisphaeraceae bacterium]|nr:LemA family protein [Tepidisphaeraceae bacterium]
MWTGIAVIAAIVVILLVAGFNRLVRLRQNVRESWSAIDTELKRRYDLIPNLVEAVKGYASHEKSTLEEVVAARNSAAANEGSPLKQVGTENNLTQSIGRLFAIAESYPQLKASESFQQLQSQLADTETRISQARRFYNANVREMNTAVMTFPSSLLSRMFGFGMEEYFEIQDPTQREVTQVKL